MGQVNAPFSSKTAGANLTDKEKFVVKLNSSGEVVLSSAGTDRHYGILEAGDVQNMPVSIRVINAQGTYKAKVGATISAPNVELTADSAGKVVPATTGDWVIGLSAAAAAADDLVEFVGAHYKK